PNGIKRSRRPQPSATRTARPPASVSGAGRGGVAIGVPASEAGGRAVRVAEGCGRRDRLIPFGNGGCEPPSFGRLVALLPAPLPLFPSGGNAFQRSNFSFVLHLRQAQGDVAT